MFLASTMGAEGFSRRVAIKRVLPGFSENPSFAKMFVDEAQISSRLLHPNIVSVLDFDRDAEQRLFLVMELVEGKDLDALCSTGLLPVPVVIFVIAEVLRGLGYAHDLPVGNGIRGVVHRDVSPHNVLLSWEGAVKVSDFGIAKARAASEATASQFIKGKPAYMSPEQANGQPLDGRSDLFAVGIMMWEMLVGRRLFHGDDTRATLGAVLFGQIPRPRSMRSDIPKDVERVTMKLLERELPLRYPTAEAAIADLLECNDAPRAGRDLLTRVMAERFPNEAPVRQNALRSRASGSGVGPSAAPTPLAPMQTGPAASIPRAHSGMSGDAMPSVSAMMSSPTSTLDGHAVPRRRGPLFKLLLVLIVAGGSGALTFAIVNVAGGKKPPPAKVAEGSGTGPVLDAGVAVTTPHDAAVAAAVIDGAVAPPAPLDAGTITPVDASTATTSTASASKRTPSSRSNSKSQGTLAVRAFPALTVYVDGKKFGDTPRDIRLPVGKHTLRLKNPASGHDERISVEIHENKTTMIERM